VKNNNFIQLVNKIIIVCIKICLTLGYMNFSDFVLPLPLKTFVSATTLIIVKTHFSQNIVIFAQCNEKCTIYSYNEIFIS